MQREEARRGERRTHVGRAGAEVEPLAAHDGLDLGAERVGEVRALVDAAAVVDEEAQERKVAADEGAQVGQVDDLLLDRALRANDKERVSRAFERKEARGVGGGRTWKSLRRRNSSR